MAEVQLVLASLRENEDWKLLEAELERRRETLLRELVGGVTHDEYLAIAGELRGLERILWMPYKTIRSRV